jgi:hypothetical protein
MHKNATKCNKTQSKWCKNKHGASKIIDTCETYHYSLLIMGDSNVDGDVSEVNGDGGGVDGVDGDGSGGNSPSRQGAGTETFVPQNWSSTAAVLQNFFGKNADSVRVFMSEALYRRRGNVRGHQGGPHHLVARPGVDPRHPMVWPAPGSPPSLLWTPSRVGKNRNFGVCFVQL